MADIVTGTVSGFVNNVPEATNATLNDVRREAAEHTNEIVREGLKGDYSTLSAIKDSRFETVSRVENNADRLERSVSSTHKDVMDRFFDLGRESADNRAQITALGYQVRDGFVAAAKDMEIQALKTQVYIADKVGADGEKTRALIESLKNADLNRMLIERNAALVEETAERRHWRHNADLYQSQGQWAALQSQLQAFQSQLQETRQGMVNFGTMAGVGQSSTSNNVR